MKKASKVDIAKITMAEEQIKGMINGGLTPSQFAIAMNNAFCHGEVLVENNFQVGENDELLRKWFDNIEAMKEIGVEMEN